MVRALAVLAVILATSVASATVLVPAEFTEVVSGSEIIVHARVVEVRPQWADGRRWVDTIVTAEVVSVLKGGTNASETIAFKVPGGQLGRYRSVFVGAPVFARGEEAILFLKSRSGDVPDVFGVNQGVYRIRVDSTSGRKMVVPPPLIAAVNDAKPRRVIRGAVERRPLAVDAFGARVREAMAQSRKGAQ